MIFFARHAEGSDNIDIFARAADSEDLEGESAMQITDAPGRDDYGEPSPDGTQVVFASNRNGNFDLYTMNADGSNQTQLTDTPHIRENLPDW
jgi:Tol biopolymer transport system component